MPLLVYVTLPTFRGEKASRDLTDREDGEKHCNLNRSGGVSFMSQAMPGRSGRFQDEEDHAAWPSPAFLVSSRPKRRAFHTHLLLCQCCSTKLREGLLTERGRKHDSNELNKRGFSVQWPPATPYLQSRSHSLVTGPPQIPAPGWGAVF